MSFFPATLMLLAKAAEEAPSQDLGAFAFLFVVMVLLFAFNRS